VRVRVMTGSIAADISAYGNYSQVPTKLSGNIRNDMYLTAEALRVIDEKRLVAFEAGELLAVQNYRRELEHATKFIPTWVKVAVALALGLGTMVCWKRIVVTVGERIGRQHLTYAQGACSELMAARPSELREAPGAAFESPQRGRLRDSGHAEAYAAGKQPGKPRTAIRPLGREKPTRAIRSHPAMARAAAASRQPLTAATRPSTARVIARSL